MSTQNLSINITYNNQISITIGEEDVVIVLDPADATTMAALLMRSVSRIEGLEEEKV